MFKKDEIKEVDLEYMTDTSAAMMQGIPIAYHFIMWAAVIFLLVAGIWANYAVLDVVTKGEGKVVPSGRIKPVQNLEGGIVKDIRVKEGQIVEKGEILMIIDDTRFSSSFKEAQELMYALRAKISRLIAESEGKEPIFSDEISKKYPNYVKSEKNLYADRQREMKKQLDILGQKKIEAQQELLAIEGKKEQLERSLKLVQKELDLTRPLVKSGAVSEVELLRLERQVNELAGELESAQISIPRLQAALLATTQQSEQYLLTKKSEARSELNEIKNKFNQLQEKIKADKDRFDRTWVRSPVRGTVNEMKITSVGAVVQPGQTLLDIVPLDDTLLIEVDIKPRDIGFIRPNLPAKVKISAYDFSIYGGLDAVVEQISSTSIENEKKERFYKVKVRTTGKNYLLGKKGEMLEIIPGMGATVDILTGQRTVLEYILKPILKAKKEAMRER